MDLRAEKPGQNIASFEGKVKAPRILVFSPDGKYLAAESTAETSVTVWTIASGERMFSHTLTSQLDQPVMGFDPSKNRLAVGTKAGELFVWNFAERKEENPVKCGGSLMSVAFTPDGTRIAIASDRSKPLRIWDLTSNQEILILRSGDKEIVKEEKVTLLSFSPDGRFLAGCLKDSGELIVWNGSLAD